MRVNLTGKKFMFLFPDKVSVSIEDHECRAGYSVIGKADEVALVVRGIDFIKADVLIFGDEFFFPINGDRVRWEYAILPCIDFQDN